MKSHLLRILVLLSVLETSTRRLNLTPTFKLVKGVNDSAFVVLAEVSETGDASVQLV